MSTFLRGFLSVIGHLHDSRREKPTLVTTPSYISLSVRLLSQRDSLVIDLAAHEIWS